MVPVSALETATETSSTKAAMRELPTASLPFCIQSSPPAPMLALFKASRTITPPHPLAKLHTPAYCSPSLASASPCHILLDLPASRSPFASPLPRPLPAHHPFPIPESCSPPFFLHLHLSHFPIPSLRISKIWPTSTIKPRPPSRARSLRTQWSNSTAKAGRTPTPTCLAPAPASRCAQHPRRCRCRIHTSHAQRHRQIEPPCAPKRLFKGWSLKRRDLPRCAILDRALACIPYPAPRQDAPSSTLHLRTSPPPLCQFRADYLLSLQFTVYSPRAKGQGGAGYSLQGQAGMSRVGPWAEDGDGDNADAADALVRIRLLALLGARSAAWSAGCTLRTRGLMSNRTRTLRVRIHQRHIFSTILRTSTVADGLFLTFDTSARPPSASSTYFPPLTSHYFHFQLGIRIHPLPPILLVSLLSHPARPPRFNL
ncbi:hypothetical protein DFH06DRAFT_1482089 [Mycena polygramma]|nr:hypothetical protein DFH06DRAFT_1482089 [Mycena polygramma]